MTCRNNHMHVDSLMISYHTVVASNFTLIKIQSDLNKNCYCEWNCYTETYSNSLKDLMKKECNLLQVNILHEQVENSLGIFMSNDFHQLKYVALLKQTMELYDEPTDSHNRYNLLVQRDKLTSNCLLFHLDLHPSPITLILSDSYIPPFQQIELSAHQLLGRYPIWNEDLRESLSKWEHFLQGWI